jgi:predicted dehydrogenase
VARKYRVAVIGRTGKGNYGHGLDVVWTSLDNVEVVAVADPDEKGRTAAAARIKAKAAYADYREMLDKERPKIVSVADRWLDRHRDMVLDCVRHGAHVFLEKPMCRTLREADEIVAACERHHVKLAIAHQTRYSPRAKVIRDLLAAGKLGDVLEMRGRGKEDHRGGGEDLMVLGTHTFDLMRFFAGDARWCFAQIRQGDRAATAADRRPGGEEIGPILGDRIAATFGFDRGVVGTFGTRMRERPGVPMSVTLLGTRGVIQIGYGSHPPAYFLDDPSWFPGQSKARWQEITSAGLDRPELLQGGQADGNAWIVRDLMDSIENDRQPLGNVYDGRAALEMILAVYESHRLQAPAELPLKNRGHPLGAV